MGKTHDALALAYAHAFRDFCDEMREAGFLVPAGRRGPYYMSQYGISFGQGQKVGGLVYVNRK